MSLADPIEPSAQSPVHNVLETDNEICTRAFGAQPMDSRDLRVREREGDA